MTNAMFGFVYTSQNGFIVCITHVNTYEQITLFFCFQDQVTLEGMVVQRAECRPAVNESYMKLKK